MSEKSKGKPDRTPAIPVKPDSVTKRTTFEGSRDLPPRKSQDKPQSHQ